MVCNPKVHCLTTGRFNDEYFVLRVLRGLSDTSRASFVQLHHEKSMPFSFDATVTSNAFPGAICQYRTCWLLLLTALFPGKTRCD